MEKNAKSCSWDGWNQLQPRYIPKFLQNAQCGAPFTTCDAWGRMGSLGALSKGRFLQLRSEKHQLSSTFGILFHRHEMFLFLHRKPLVPSDHWTVTGKSACWIVMCHLIIMGNIIHFCKHTLEKTHDYKYFNQPPPPIFFCNLKTGGPPGLINRFGRTWLINHQCWNPILFYCPTLFIFNWFPYSILKLKPHEHQNPSLLIIENLEKKTIPQNDRFLIEFFIKMSSFDSSQRVPPMSPCAPLIIRGFPLLIDPFQGGVYLLGKLGKTLQGIPWPSGGVLMLQIRCWHY